MQHFAKDIFNFYSLFFFPSCEIIWPILLSRSGKYADVCMLGPVYNRNATETDQSWIASSEK